ncbi:MAG: hypothetical protein LUC43_07100 [Burkholderiales bacterium]|nr:hypothetical protein [Burkholderiales bacterium]
MDPLPPFSSLKLTTTKVTGGRVYVMAYKSKWIPEKKQSRIVHKEYVGAVDSDTGRVRPTPQFLKNRPEMADKILYYTDNQLVAQNPNETKKIAGVVPENYPEYAQELSFGASWACWQTAKDHGILKDLKEVFGNDGESMLKVAIYWYLTGDCMDAFADWQCETWLPPSEILTGRRISELLAKVDVPLMTAYFKLRFKHNLEGNDNGEGNRKINCGKKALKPSNKNETSFTNNSSNIDKPSAELGVPPPKHYLALDLASFSTYPEIISETTYGYEKQNPKLRQANVTVVVDFITGDIVYAFVSEEFIPANALFDSIMKKLKATEFDLDKIVLVTNRGYASHWHLQSLINSDVSFISSVPISEKSIRDKFIKYEHSFIDPEFWIKGIPMGARTFNENFVQLADFGRNRIKGWLHFYKSPGKGEFNMANFITKLDKVIERRNKSEKIPPDEWKQYASFIIEKDGLFKRNLDEIRKKIALEETLALYSNCVKDPKVCLIAYRQRNQVENSFWHLEVGNCIDRLHTSDTSYLGKIFMFLIAQSIRVVHLTNVRRNQTNQLTIPGDSVDRLLAVLNKVEVRKYGVGKNWMLQTVPKKARDCLALLGIEEKLPHRVTMF